MQNCWLVLYNANFIGKWTIACSTCSFVHLLRKEWDCCVCYGKFCRELKITSFLRKLIFEMYRFCIVLSRSQISWCTLSLKWDIRINCNLNYTHIICTCTFTVHSLFGIHRTVLFFMLVFEHIKFLKNVYSSQKKKVYFCMADHCGNHLWYYAYFTLWK